MYLAYFDESGDDGFPDYSSEVFVLTSGYLHHQKWQGNYMAIKDFRKALKANFGIPVKTEFKAREFILNKNPFRDFSVKDEDRVKILKAFASFLATFVIQNKITTYGAFALSVVHFHYSSKILVKIGGCG